MQDEHLGFPTDSADHRAPIRVLVASVRPAERAGLRALLDGEPGIAVVAEAATASLSAAGAFEVAVVALSPGESPAFATEDLGPEFPVVLLGSWSGLGASSLAKGPRALLDVDADAGEIAAAVQAAASGLTVFGAGALAALLRQEPQPDGLLTPREHDVLRLLAMGLPNKSIALRLQISEHTAKFHVGSILSKLGAESRTEAVMIAARRGLLPL